MSFSNTEASKITNLLLVDDDPVFRLLYGRSLEDYSRFNSDIVDGVSSALSAIATKQYAVVISDGLCGGWTEVLGAAMEQEARPILYTADLEFVRFATNIEIEVYDKGRTTFRQVLDLILDHPAS